MAASSHKQNESFTQESSECTQWIFKGKVYSAENKPLNDKVKGVSGVTGMTEDESALRRWLIADF